MNGVIWLLWLAIAIGTCYCSYGNNYTAKYCGDSALVEECESKNASIDLNSNYVSLRVVPRVSLAPPANGPPSPPKPSKKRQKLSPNAFDPTLHADSDIREAVNGVDKFQVKHMYMDGKLGDKVNSFDQLTGNPEKVRRYLVELNRRIFKGDVLPATISSTQTFETWMQESQTKPKKVSLIDGDLVALQKDITSQEAFKTYLDEVQKGTRKAMNNNLFKTTEKYFITEITLQADSNNNLDVKIERFKAKLEIGMDSERVFHYHKSDRSVINEKSVAQMNFVDSSSQDPILQTKFTEAELRANEKATLEFWQEMFGVTEVDDVRFNKALNEDSKKYKDSVKNFEKQWEDVISPQKDASKQQAAVIESTPGACARGGAGRKKRAGARCAFYVDLDGEVESIHPQEFMEVFELEQEEGRGRMVRLLKKNGDKYIVNDDQNWQAARRRMNQIIHHDEMTIHAEVVETTGRIQDWRRWKNEVLKKPSQIVTAISDAVSTRMTKVKLSSTKVVHNLAKNPHVIRLSKVQQPYGNLMMAKGLITGILHNDTTAIAVMGSRLGYDIVTGVGEKAGKKFFNAATKVGKGARVLGKVAGPIGSMVDIGLGAWSLSKDVKRLKDADNQYDRDDAIADIVGDSIDVVVGTVSLVLSVAFPPAAPLIFAVAFVINILTSLATTIFKASNAVKRINSEIPLSGAEKTHVFTSRAFDFFGLREKDYLDYLVEEKHANDQAVKSYLQFLRKTDQFMGVLFPSRSLSMSGGCKLVIYSKCAGKIWGRPMCLYYQTYHNCTWNTPCTPEGRSCVNEQTGSEFYDCICDDNTQWANFGGSHTDSDVDFRQKRTVYWERSVPGDVSGAEFKCKPSYLKYTDHRTQQYDSRNEYHCFHAIGLYLPQKERKKGQSFLVNLEDGKDSLITDQQSDDTPYTFWLGEKGQKSFWGGKTKNEFILNGNCSAGLLSGNLYGGPEATDSLIVGPSCAKGEIVEFTNPQKFGGNKLRVYLSDKLNLDMERIENIIGRPKDPETVYPVCNTRKLFLNGGASSSKPDKIVVDPLDCSLDLVTMLGNYTDFSSRALNGDITVYVGQEMEGSSINVVRPNSPAYKNPKTTIIFTEITSEAIDIQQSTLTSRESSLKLWDSSSHSRSPLTVKYHNEHSQRKNEQYQLFFNESSVDAPNTFSILTIPGNDGAEKMSGPLTFFHNLQGNKASIEKPVSRVGSPNIPNLFKISGNDWNLRGGQKDDTFLLNADISRISIDGNGGQNTLVVLRAQKSLIDLNDKLKNIATVIKGDENESAMDVSTGCDTKAVVVQGKYFKYSDTVKIHKCTGPRELQVDAGGWASVVVDGDLTGENEIVRVVAHRTSSTPLKLRLETENAQASKMFVQVELGQRPETLNLREMRKNRDGKSFRAVMWEGGVDGLDLNLKINEDDGFYLSTPQIQLRPKTGLSSQLVFRRDTLDPVAVHVVKEDSKEEFHIIGFKQMENLFQIQANLWTIEGGGLKDTFIGEPIELVMTTLKPNEKSDNTLVINYDDKSTHSAKATQFQVNLQEGRMGWKGEFIDGKIVGGFIQHVIGRPNQNDVIATGCVVKSVAGRGGFDQDHPDLVVIKDIENCVNDENEMEVHLGRYTKVENSAENGTFKYFVDLEEPILDTNPFTINSTATNHHKIVFEDGEKQSNFKTISFDQQQQKLSFQVRNTVMEFPMYRADEQSDYTNPKFLVTSKDKWVTRDVRVDNEGSVVSTALVDTDCVSKLERSSKGLPVDINNFMINIITQEERVSCETVLEAGENSKSNHFWLYGISSNNHLTIRGVENSEQISSVHLDKDFLGDKSIVTNLSSPHGFITIPDQPDVKLVFIDKFVGRSNPISYDIVHPSCHTKQVSGVDLVTIEIDPERDCEFNLIIGMEPGTQVNFEWNGQPGSGRDNLSEFWSSTFHYRFAEPMSFELGQSYPGLLEGTEHNLYLPFSLDEMETLTFVKEENKLYYTVDSEKYSVTMLSKPDIEDQFYPQPTMVTQDGLRLLVGRDSSLLVSGELKGSNSTGKELLEEYQDLANTLGVTMVLQTDAGLLHVGHNSATDRNVVQNVAYSDSHLGGGGTLNTIYEVVSLDKNVYIAPGINDQLFVASSVNVKGAYSAKQTLDLTDIVSPIRYQTMKKYKPVINQAGEDLIITMEGHLEKYPGQIVIYGGVSEGVRDKLQVLLSHAMMKITPPDAATGNKWQLVPIPVRLERETVYSLAAEDLEYDHHISVLDHLYGPEYHFRFDYSKHGDDLHLSDIEEFQDHRYDERHIEMTTVIITDFYKKLKAEEQGYTIEVAGETNGVDYGDAPAEIVNVILDLPGLKIKLDGTDVYLLDNQNVEDEEMEMEYYPIVESVPVLVNASTSTNSTPPMMAVQPSSSSLPLPTFQAPGLLEAKSISEWTQVLHQVEEKILEELPFVHRYY